MLRIPEDYEEGKRMGRRRRRKGGEEGNKDGKDKGCSTRRVGIGCNSRMPSIAIVIKTTADQLQKDCSCFLRPENYISMHVIIYKDIVYKSILIHNMHNLHMHIYAYIYICKSIYTCIRIHICTYMHMYVHVYMYMYV